MSVLAERAGPSLPLPRGTRFTALVVAADAAVRAEVVRRLQRLGALEVASASCLSEARRIAAASGPREMAVVEPVLDDGSGIGLITELRAAGWGAGIVLSSHQSPFAVRAAMAAGARGFVVTGAAGPAVPALGGDPVLSRARARQGASAGAEGLSSREVQVLQQVADGRSNKDIGETLGLSALTVKSHLARIARKLGTGDRAAMVALALRARVIA